MPSHRAMELRLQELEMQERVLVEQIEDAKENPSDRQRLAELMLRYKSLTSRSDEIRRWQKEDEDNPAYGTQIRVDGQWRPKLPVFGSVEKALEIMCGGPRFTPAFLNAAREFRAAQDAQETVRVMDGRSPLLPEEERKPFNATL